MASFTPREMKEKELIGEAKLNLSLIAEKTRSCPEGYYTAFYLGENGYTAGHIQRGWEPRGLALAFGSKSLTENEVIDEINHYDRWN